jgi:hypothetical protein
LLTRWKKEALEGLPGVFSTAKKKTENDNQKLIDELYKQIGQLKVENDRLKKRLIQSVSDRKGLIDKNHPDISINRQCELLQVSKGALYYKSKPIRTLYIDEGDYVPHPLTTEPEAENLPNGTPGKSVFFAINVHILLQIGFVMDGHKRTITGVLLTGEGHFSAGIRWSKMLCEVFHFSNYYSALNIIS